VLAATTDWDYISPFDAAKPLYGDNDTVARSTADWCTEQQQDAT